jgi:hypothetical protein
LSPKKGSLGGCRSFERKGRSWRPVPPKAALFGGYRRVFGRRIACQPRRYVAEKISRRGPAGLWMTVAALQRLAF